jgi:hypothetical protein
MRASPRRSWEHLSQLPRAYRVSYLFLRLLPPGQEEREKEMKKIAWGNIRIEELDGNEFRAYDEDGAVFDLKFVVPVISDEDAARLMMELEHRIRCGT